MSRENVRQGSLWEILKSIFFFFFNHSPSYWNLHVFLRHKRCHGKVLPLFCVTSFKETAAASLGGQVCVFRHSCCSGWGGDNWHKRRLRWNSSCNDVLLCKWNRFRSSSANLVLSMAFLQTRYRCDASSPPSPSPHLLSPPPQQEIKKTNKFKNMRWRRLRKWD